MMTAYIYCAMGTLFSVLGMMTFIFICSVSVIALSFLVVKNFWRVLLAIGAIGAVYFLITLMAPGFILQFFSTLM